MSLIERDRAKAIDAMVSAIGVRSKVRDSIGDMLDAALDSGALVWASSHHGAVAAIDEATQVILDALSALHPPQARELMESSAYKAFAAYNKRGQ